MISNKMMARNVVWNVAGTASEAAAAFLIAPYLVRELGSTKYGIWIVIGSLVTYFGLLDLGVRGSVGRFLALHRARGDRQQSNATISTAMAICCVAGLVVMLASIGAQFLFFRLFDVPAELVSQTRVALELVCLSLALVFPFNLFDGILWSEQRFDIINAIDIPATALRVILCYVAVRLGYGISGLAIVNVAVLIVVALLKAYFGFRNDPLLRMSIADINRKTARELIAYGSTRLLMTLARLSRLQLTNVVIGSVMGLATVTLYSLGRRLIEYSESAVAAATGVIVPLATTLQANGDESRQQTLFIQGGKFTSALAFCFLGFFVSLGRMFILLWMGPRFASASDLMVILAVGETLPLCQLTTNSILLGIDKHRCLALLMIIEASFLLVSGCILSSSASLVPFCYAAAAFATIFRGILLTIYGCRTLDVPFFAYLRLTLLPGFLCAVLPSLGMTLLVHEFPPTRWVIFFAYCFLYAILCGIACLGLLGKEPLLRLKSKIQQKPARLVT